MQRKAFFSNSPVELWLNSRDFRELLRSSNVNKTQSSCALEGHHESYMVLLPVWFINIQFHIQISVIDIIYLAFYRLSP